MGEHLTERQKFEFKEIFSLYDRDSDGIISKNDLEHLLNFLGLRLTKEELQDIVNEVNSEGDEKITYNSFLYLMARQIKDTGTSEEIIEAFTAFDDDHDGLIKTDDFRNYLKNMEQSRSPSHRACSMSPTTPVRSRKRALACSVFSTFSTAGRN